MMSNLFETNASVDPAVVLAATLPKVESLVTAHSTFSERSQK